MKPVIFSGTTEGRTLSEKLTASGITHIVCVATEYGELVMEPSEYADIRTGRLTGLEMYDLIRSEADRVFDATHPYAAEVSHNIQTACKAADIEYVRIIRENSGNIEEASADIHVFDSAASCAKALADTEGNILLTTGSKELGIYAADEGIRSRLYARVLPSHESINLCEGAGLAGRHIIAMQGPFSRETDLAMIHQYDIRVLVTKASGRTGGEPGKIRAAAEAGIPVYMIGRPADEPGLSVEEALAGYFGIRSRMHIDLVGIGPGNRGLMTADAGKAVENADILFGAARMIRGFEGHVSYPYYRAEDIIPVLEEKRPARAAVLFSGDTGFYSGAAQLAPKLRAWAAESRDSRNEYRAELSISIHPGISSFSYLAARAGISYQDARMVSIHGCSGDARAVSDLIRTVRYSEKTFVLLSGPGDVRLAGETLMHEDLGHVRIILGYQLSYPEERIGLISPADCSYVDEPGLYTAVLINERAESRPVAPVISDDDMARGRVPMTKESIRHLSVLKLGLIEGSVVYDIGSGTGSIACEIAELDPAGTVYAVEMKKEACSLIRENADRLGLSNIQVIEGTAPEALEDLEAPTHVFIGGSSGNLKEILDEIRCKTNAENASGSGGIRVVINAVSLETMAEISEVIRNAGISDVLIEQVSVSRARELGRYHLMTSENPVMIASFTLGGRRA